MSFKNKSLYRYLGECGHCEREVAAVAPSEWEKLWVRCGGCDGITAIPYSSSNTK